MDLISIAVLSLGTAASLTPPPPPPAVSRSGIARATLRPPRVRQLVSWDASEATCENGANFGAEAVPRIIPISTFRPPEQPPSVTYEFTLGRDGRALSIDEAEGNSLQLYGTDLAPALAAARFAPQERPTRCAVTFTMTVTPEAEASLEDLMMLRMHSRNSRVASETWQRFVPGNCSSPRKRQLEKHTPDYRKLRRLPGARRWTMTRYNIDENGVPYGLETIAGSGEPQLDAAARKALADSRWIDGDPREGCWRYDYLAAGVIPAPEAPEPEQFGASPEQCDARDRWEREPKLTYPSSFQRRGIEGWAILRYDVASWGEIGNVEVLDAQPAASLGDVAQRVLMSARYKKSEGGLSGCVETVRFRLPEKGPGQPDDEE